jgi:hypothetical protein
MIGDAYVVISPDTDGFRPLLEVKVREAIAGIDPKIPIGLSVDRNALGQFLTAAQRAANIKVNMETGDAAASIIALRERIQALSQLVADIPIGADDTKMLATIAGLQGKIAALADRLSDLQLNADSTALTAKIAAIQAQQVRLAASLEKMEADVDIQAALAQLAALKAQEDLLTKDAENIRLGISTEGLGTTEAQLLGLEATAKSLSATLTETAAKSAALAAAEAGLSSVNRDLAKAQSDTTAGMASFQRGTGGMVAGLLTARVALFGGVTAVTGFHIAFDALIEAAAVIVPALSTAAAGLGAFAVAGSDSAREVYQMVTSIHTVGDAMNATIPPMTGKLEALHDQVRPEVWQLYGDAIDVVHTKTGLFNNLATQTGGVLDTLAARFTVLITNSGPGLAAFLDAGKRDLAEFGQIALSLGDAFDKLIKITQETHIADYLLDIVAAGAKLLDMITKLPTPLLAVVVGLHGLYLWGGLATTGVLNLIGGLTKLAASAAGVKLADTAIGDLAANGNGLQKLSANASILGASVKNLPERFAALGEAIGGLASNPWTWAVVGVVALSALVIWTLNAKDATDKWITSSKKIVDSASLYTAVNTTASQLVQTTGKLNDANTKLIGSTGRIGPTMADAAHSTQALTNYHQDLTNQLTTEIDRITGVSVQFGTTLPGAMALATFAGVKMSDLTSTQNKVWETALQKISGVVDGYKAMGQGSAQLGNDIAVINVGASDQAKAITNLNTAWDSFIKVVGAPVDTFLTFSQTLVRFGADAEVSGAKMTGLGSGIQDVSKKVTNSSIQLQQDFQSSFESANQLFDAMRSSQAPADQQIKAVKDTIATLIPLAGTSKVAAAEISSLAQEAGGPATTNLQTLQKWAGETSTKGMQGLQKDTNNAAVAMSNLSQDAAKLGSTLQSDLNAEMAKSVENAVGLQGAMDKYTTSLHDNGAVSAETGTDRKKLYDDLVTVFHSADQANSVIKTLSGAFTQNGVAADTSKGARQQLTKDLVTAADNSKNAQSALSKYTDIVTVNGVNTSVAKDARAQLVKDLTNAGVNSKTATTDVTNYTTAVKNNGVTSDNAKQARQQLITDILNANNNSKLANTALSNYTAAVKDDGLKSDAAKAARQQLIKDLINAGVNSKTSNTDVTNYTTAIKNNGINSDQAKAARQQLITDILNASKNAVTGRTDLANYTTAVQDNGSKSSAAQSARARLLADLKQSGLNSQAAKTLVDGLTKSITLIPGGKQIGITVTGKGTWSISQGEALQKALISGTKFGAAGGVIPGYGPGRDTVHAMLSPGEGILVPEAVQAIGPDMVHALNAHYGSGRKSTGMMAHGAPPHFAAGGVVGGNAAGLSPWMNTQYDDTQAAMTQAVADAMTGAINSAVKTAAAASAASIGLAGISNSSAVAALQSAAAKAGWTGAQWTALENVEMREAGFSLTARNPSSGAYGMAQFINGPSEYAQYGGNSTTAAGQAVAMVNYIKQRYGNPEAAWAHEQAFNWYSGGGVAGKLFDKGGTLAPGWNPPMYNATGRDEQLANVTGSGSRAHPTTPGHVAPHTPAEAEMIGLLRQLVSVTGQQGGQFAGAISGAAGGAALRGTYNNRRG